MIDLEEIEKRHVETKMDTDPSGIHYSSYNKKYMGCPECDIERPCDAITLIKEIKRLYKGLDKLSKLGNEPHLGNSNGNVLSKHILEGAWPIPGSESI